jgi:uncharacterized protein (DUF2267 family)
MSATGLDVFDRTLKITNIWLDDIMREMGWSSRQRAYHALRAVLHTLRDRLAVTDAVHLAAQFPILVRGVFFDGWRPECVPVDERSRDEFLMHVTDAFLFVMNADCHQITAAVLRVLTKHVSPGEVEKARRALPEAVRELWPASIAAPDDVGQRG